MTHEGRMERGKLNFEKGLLNNADTKYYLDNQPKEVEVKITKKKGKEE